MRHHVFLSYSRRDTDFMERIRDYLRGGGLQVWTDEALEAGTESWKAAIQEAIENTDTIVVMLSPDSKKSEWVRRELDYASTHGRRIYPVMVRGNEVNSVPFSLAGAQYADVRTDFDAGMKQLRKAIHSYVDIPMPAPPPRPAAAAHGPQAVTTSAPPVEDDDEEMPSLVAQQLVMTKPPAALVLFRNALPYLLLLFIVLVGITSNDNFASSRNFTVIANSALTTATLALAATFLLTIRSVDMAAGAILGVSALIFSLVAQDSGENPGLFAGGVIAAIFVALLLSYVHGWVTRTLRNTFNITNSQDARLASLVFVSPSVLVTSLTAPVIVALTIALSNSVTTGAIMVRTPIRISSGDFPWIPAMLVVLFVVGEIVVRRPNVRQRISELQSSLAPSDTGDGNIQRLFLMVFLLAGVLIAAGGILIVLRLQSYSISLDATSLQYAALAAVFVGGSSLFSERITFIGSLVGVAIVTMMNNVLLLMGYPFYWGTLLTSALLLVALVLDFLTTPRPKVVRVAEGSVSGRKRAASS